MSYSSWCGHYTYCPSESAPIPLEKSRILSPSAVQMSSPLPLVTTISLTLPRPRVTWSRPNWDHSAAVRVSVGGVNGGSEAEAESVASDAKVRTVLYVDVDVPLRAIWESMLDKCFERL
jgi:hypothetical protein